MSYSTVFQKRFSYAAFAYGLVCGLGIKYFDMHTTAVVFFSTLTLMYCVAAGALFIHQALLDTRPSS